jgi:hypothetical protein
MFRVRNLVNTTTTTDYYYYYYYLYYYYDTHMHVHVHVAEREWYAKGRRAQRKAGRLQEKKREKRRKRDSEKAQHWAFPRGPPPQYYPGSNLLDFAVRMGSGEPG